MVSVDPKRVELKLSIGADGPEEATEWLGLKDSEAARATIWFCDQVASGGDGVRFELFDRGVIVRLRRKHGDDDSNTTIKYRREAPLVLPPGWDPEATPDFKVEGDWTIRSRMVAASLDSTVAGATIDEAGRAGPPLPRSLFSDDQRRFVTDLIAPRSVDLAALRPLGPIDAWRWEEAPRRDLDKKVGAERWKFDGREFLELSTRVRFENGDEWLNRFATWATDGGLNIASVGTTKTQAVLEHFAGRLGP
jgi:hypothetical protein